MKKERFIALVLLVLFGGLGIHNFYLGENKKGIIQAALGTIGWLFIWFLLIPQIILVFWLIYDFGNLALLSDETFDCIYNKKEEKETP